MKIEYWVIKNGDKYYAPYLSWNYIYEYDSENILTDRREFAVRFGTREIAEACMRRDSLFRRVLNQSLSPNVRVVKIIKKVKK